MKKILIALAFTAMYLPALSQKIKDFEKALANGRGLGKAYWFDMSQVKPEKAKQIARDNNYIITEIENVRVKFVPKAEYDAYVDERNFTQKCLYEYAKKAEWHDDYICGKGEDWNYYDLSSYYWFDYKNASTDIKGKVFKQKGTAYLYDEGKFLKLTDIHWSGNTKNGLLEGHGYGYLITNEGEKTIYRSIIGSFNNGIPGSTMFMAKSIAVKNRRWTQKPFEQSIVEYGVGSFSEGLAPVTIAIPASRGRSASQSVGFVDQQGNLVIPAMYNSLVSGFVNGEAIVTYGIHDVKIAISKQNTVVEFIGRENMTVLPRGIFKDPIFRTVKSLKIPESVVRIESGAFEGVSSLEEVICSGNSLTTIDGWAFAKCNSLRKVILPNSISRINNYAFENCISLEYVSIPSTLNWENAKTAFVGCNKLTSVVVRNADGTTTKNMQWISNTANEQSRRAQMRANREQSVDYDTMPTPNYQSVSDWSSSGYKSWVKSIRFSDGTETYIARYEQDNGQIYYSGKSILTFKYKTERDAAAAEWVWIKFHKIRHTGSFL